jgi:hypothetical protein
MNSVLTHEVPKKKVLTHEGCGWAPQVCRRLLLACYGQVKFVARFGMDNVREVRSQIWDGKSPFTVPPVSLKFDYRPSSEEPVVPQLSIPFIFVPRRF